MFRYRLHILNLILVVAVLGGVWGRRQDENRRTVADYLKGMVLPFRNMTTTDYALSPDEVSMLQPDAALVRRYSSNQTMEAELAVVAGHHKRSVHAPGFCMVGGGWDTLWQRDTEISIPNRTIPAIQMMMSKEGRQMLVTYFFTTGGFCARSLIQFQGIQFLRRIHGESTEGALVRISVAVKPGDEKVCWQPQLSSHQLQFHPY